MENRKKQLDIRMRTNRVRKCEFVIGDGDRILGWVWKTITANLSELDDDIHIKMFFELDWNETESISVQEQNECYWLFKNLVEVIGYDLRHLIDDNICDRINSALPTKIKVFRKD